MNKARLTLIFSDDFKFEIIRFFLFDKINKRLMYSFSIWNTVLNLIGSKIFGFQIKAIDTFCFIGAPEV